MGIEMKEEDIVATHRLGKAGTQGGKRTVICKFVRRKQKREMLTKQKNLKIQKAMLMYSSEKI